MRTTEKGAPPAAPPERPASAAGAEVVALRGALRIETRLAEALACRSRGLIDTVDALTRRALAEARDIEDARARLEDLGMRLRHALDAGDAARPERLPRLAELTLAAFETAEGPRIACGGPAVGLGPEAARLVGLTLFELASRSLRHGALALEEGRAALSWRLRGDGALRLLWREYGAPPGSESLRSGVGGALLPLLAGRFGGPLQVRATPFGLRAELIVPPGDLSAASGGGGPGRPAGPSFAAGSGVVLAAVPGRGLRRSG